MDDLLLAATTASTLFNVLVIICAFRLFKRSGDTMHVFIISTDQESRDCPRGFENHSQLEIKVQNWVFYWLGLKKPI